MSFDKSIKVKESQKRGEDVRDQNSGQKKGANNNRHTPAFSVQDEIRRNRRLSQNKRIRQARETGRKLFAVLLSLTVVVITLIAVLLTVTRVRTVTVSGNERYSVDEILLAAEVDGDILPLMGKNSVYKKIVSACPYVNGIELKKSYPSSVEIVVTEAEVVYCAYIHDRLYSLDADLRVIEFTDNSDGLVELTLPEVVTVLEGSKIEFSDDRNNDLIPTVLDSMFGDINALPLTTLNLSNRFSISGTVGDGVKINFGDYNDISLKLNAASQLIEKATQQQSSRTLINVSVLSGSGPSMILDYEGEF